MDKKTAGVLGLVGGLIALISIALPWASVSVMGVTVSSSGIDYLKDGDAEARGMSGLVLIGGIIALLGGLGLTAVKELPPKILPVGGVLALIGGIWALARIDFDIVSYGVYAAIIGAILALVGSVAVLKEK